MALGVDGMRARRVIMKAFFLTLGTLVFVVSLTMVYESMRAVMDIGGSCASGGPYNISRPCPKGVGWMMTVGIFGMMIGTGISFLGVFPQGGPRPYVFSWSALFLALGWNFLDYGFDAPGGGAAAGWLVCGFVFVAMGGLPLLFLLSPKAARWSFWGPNTDRPDDYLHPYKPPPVRKKNASTTPATPTAPPPSATSSTPYARPAPAAAPVWSPVPEPVATAPEPEPEPTPEPEPGGDVVEQLATLADLRERGMLDDDEYERAKAAVLRTETPT